MSDVEALCEKIRKDYSPCDVSDALLTLHVPNAGYLKDIAPIPGRNGSNNRLVAPISTVLFVDSSHQPGQTTYPGLLVPESNNIPKDKHFSDMAPSGSVVLMQQPQHQIAALLGDIVATRYKYRGIKGVFIDSRARDVVNCSQLCSDGHFQVWSKALASPGTSLEGKPWAVDVPLTIDKVTVNPGDILVADEGEHVCCVIPREKLEEIVEILPTLKEADDGLLADVRGGMGFKEAVKRWPKHYSNLPH